MTSFGMFDIVTSSWRFITMSEVMKGAGLAHVLAEALSNSKVQFGQNKKAGATNT